MDWLVKSGRALLEEYRQTWEDFRYRTKVEMTVLSIYFAASAGLIAVYSQAGSIDDLLSKYNVRVGTAIVGLLLSFATVSLLLGERRAWSADIERLLQLEPLLSIGPNMDSNLTRIAEFDQLWRIRGYSLSLSGSFFWFLFLVGGVNLVHGCLLGLVLSFGDFDWLLAGVIATLTYALFLCYHICWVAKHPPRERDRLVSRTHR